MHEQELQEIIESMRNMKERFHDGNTRGSLQLTSADRATFKRLVLEAKAMLGSALGLAHEFSIPLMQMSNLQSFGILTPPNPEQVDEAIELVIGGLNQVRRQLNQPSAPLGIKQKPPYVAPSRISELQALRSPQWDPLRLIRMLQELNLAHEHGMEVSKAMLVRAITDHIPPVFGKTKFAEVAAQHSAGSVEGRSFKGAMAPLTDSMKHIADGLLHVHIRTRESLPSATQVDFNQSLDVLLGEVIRVLRK